MSFFSRLFPERAAKRSLAELRAWLPEMASGEARAIFEGHLAQVEAMSPSEMRQALAEQKEPVGYIREGSTAVIPISGVMLPARDAFLDWIGADYTSTPDVEHAIHRAEADKDVDSIVFAVDSPGGFIRGVHDLAEAVVTTTKPTHAHAIGMMSSAALWPSVRADRVTADPSAIVGSIGILTTVDDSSAAFEERGVKRHLIATGPLKGQGTPGVPVSDEALAEVRAIVDAHFEPFKAAVSEGRNLTGKALDDVTTGGAWPAARAMELGLVDALQRTPRTISELVGSSNHEDAPETGAANNPGGIMSKEAQSAVSLEAFDALKGEVENIGARLEATAQERDRLAQTVTKLEAKAETDAETLKAVKAEQRKDVIDAAQKAGKVVPATRAAAEKLGEAYGDDVDGFRTTLAAYPVITRPDVEGEGEKLDQDKQGALSGEEQAMAAQFGLTAEEWRAANPAEGVN